MADDNENEIGIEFNYSPDSRLLINGKDCEKWIQFTEEVIRELDLNLGEAGGMLCDYIATQAAMHDHMEGGGTEYVQHFVQLIGALYNNKREMLIQGGMEELGSVRQSKH